MNYKSVISDEVRRFMLQQKLSQNDLGKLLNLNQVDISNRLSGRVRWTVDDIDALARAGVDLPSPSDVVKASVA